MPAAMISSRLPVSFSVGEIKFFEMRQVFLATVPRVIVFQPTEPLIRIRVLMSFAVGR